MPTTPDRPDWMNQYRWAVGRRIRDLRVAAGYNQISFGLEIGMSDQTLSRIENGHRAADLDQLARIARGLALQPWELLRLPEATDT